MAGKKRKHESRRAINMGRSFVDGRAAADGRMPSGTANATNGGGMSGKMSENI
jgi:hypothetical protein